MIKTILILVFTLCSINSFARFGLADWTEETPHGNNINNFNEKCLYMRNGVKVNCLNEWYFYNDCVIGIMGTAYNCHTYKYFVANEMFNTVDTFDTKQKWESFIELHHLEPLIWKRIYSFRWSQITSFNFFVFYIYGFYVSIPLTIILYQIAKRAIKREHFNRRKPYTITTIIIISLFLIRYLLDVFPSSI